MRGQGSEFMEKTKYPYLETSDQVKGLPQPPFELPPNKEGEIIDLPNPKNVNGKQIPLSDAINQRSSIRTYSNSPLSLEELSYVLWCMQGVKEVINRPATSRTVPSAGARHCFELFFLVNNVEGLRPGLYRFLAIDHKIQRVNEEQDIAERITQACLNQRFILTSSVTFVLTAVRYRMMWRYTERGYRYMHLDAGHVMQNLYLCAEEISSGVCAIAAFNDDKLNTELGIDGVEQFAIYIGTIGKRK